MWLAADAGLPEGYPRRRFPGERLIDLDFDILQAIDDTCERFEDLLQSGQQPSIVDWLPGDWEPESRRVLFKHLLELDADYRRRSGSDCSAEHYRSRYPDYSGVIDQVLAPANASGPLGPGSKLGPFEIVRELGRGGMGIVFEARQTGLERRVALKVLPKAAVFDESTIRRFENEARAVASLHHSNIVPLFEAGESDGVRYYAMQLIEGQPLDQVIRELRDGDGEHRLDSRVGASAVRTAPESPASPGSTATGHRPAPRRAHAAIARIGLQVADALATAHRQGVLHRDIKPSNLILDDSGRVWVTDFGLARLAESDLTQSSDFLGTLRYMSPERFDGEGDERVDVYALGATLYELTTLQPAFPGGDQVVLLDRIRKEDPPALDRLVPDLPRDLLTIIEKCLAKEPARRYRTARDLADDLQRFLESRPIRARRATPIERLVFWSRRNPAAALLLSVLLSVAVAAVVAAIEFRDQSEENRRLAQSEKTLRSDLQDSFEQMTAARNELRENLYFANMNLATNALATQSGSQQARLLLDPWRSTEGDQDLRGFEWYLLSSMAAGADRSVLADGSWMPQIAWTPDHVVARRGPTQVTIWSTDTLRRVEVLPCQDDGRIALSRDGRLLAYSAPEGTVHIVDLTTRQRQTTIPTEATQHRELALLQNGRRLHVLGAGEDASHLYEIWDVASGKQLSKGEIGNIDRGAVSPNGRWIATAKYQGQVEVRDAESLQSIGEVRLQGIPGDMAFAPDEASLAVTGRDDGILRVWSIPGLELRHELPAQRNWGGQVEFSSEGRYLVVAGGDASLFVFDRSNQATWRLSGPTTDARSFSFAPAGHEPASELIAGDAKGGIFTWDLAEPVALRQIPTADGFSAFQFSEDGERLLAAPLHQPAQWISVQTGELEKPPLEWLVGWSAQERRFVDILPNEVGVLDIQTGVRRVASFPNVQQVRRLGAVVMAQNRIVVVNDGEVWASTFDLDDAPRKILQLPDKSGPIPVAISPDGTRLVVGFGGEFQHFDLATTRRISSLRGRWSGNQQFLFHPDGQSLVIGGDDQKIMIWDLRDGSEPRIFSGHSQRMTWVAFSPDGSRLASASQDGTVKLWEVSTGRVALNLVQDEVVVRIAWSPSGEVLATGTRQGTVRLYNASSAYASERSND